MAEEQVFDEIDSKQQKLGIPKTQLCSQVSIERNAVFSLLIQLAVDNQVFFERCAPSVFASRIADCCHEISLSTKLLTELVMKLQEKSKKCDYDENTPGNGFRSLVCLCDVVILRLISVLRVCSESRSFIMFRMSHYCKEIESFGAILRFLILAFHQVISLIDSLEDDSLFPPLENDYEQYNGFLKCIESLDASCFYGRPLGFQFCPSVTRIFRIIGIVLATYSLSWESRSSAFGSLLHSGKLLLNPEERAVRIIKVTREADIEFCRGFWNLSEIPVPKLFCPLMAICENREIPLAGPMVLETNSGMFVKIPEPSAHTGPRPVRMKVLSLSQRIGLSNSSSTNKAPLSPWLVIHCHGGGYVATSSKSHETYLRSWAKSLDCPLVSIDYSLSPENPFPRPTEEVLYAYAWILNNPNKLGWTGEKVCMVGDSAGGNLIVSVNIRLIELDVKRLPDGIIPIYTPFLFQYLPSPSRVLSFMDPLLHMGVVIRCAAAYTGSYPDEELDKNCTFNIENRKGNKQRKSLLEYVNQVQKAQHDHVLDFSHGSQSIVSLINLTQGRSNFFSNLYNNNNATSTPCALTPDTKNYNINQEKHYDKNVIAGSDIVNETIEDKLNDIDMTMNVTLADDEEINYKADLNEVEEEDEPVEGDMNNSQQTVQVDGDIFHICLSSTNMDQSLLGYLQHHPTTKSFIQPEVLSTHGDESDADKSEIILGDTTCDLEANDSVFDSNQILSTPTGCLPKSNTTGSMTNFLLASSKSVGAGSVADSTPRTSFSRFSNGASAGRTPIFAEKRKLARNKYRSLSQSLADTAVLAAGHAYDNISEWFDTPKTPIGHSDKQKLKRAATLSAQAAAQVHLQETLEHKSHFTELLKLKLPRNYLVSPLYAPPEILRKLPPMSFVACHLDPLLDDTVMFARKVRDSGGCVASIDILDSLPHGFLNFAPMSTDCYSGANLCLNRIREVFVGKKSVL